MCWYLAPLLSVSSVKPMSWSHITPVAILETALLFSNTGNFFYSFSFFHLILFPLFSFSILLFFAFILFSLFPLLFLLMLKLWVIFNNTRTFICFIKDQKFWVCGKDDSQLYYTLFMVLRRNLNIQNSTLRDLSFGLNIRDNTGCQTEKNQRFYPVSNFTNTSKSTYNQEIQTVKR